MKKSSHTTLTLPLIITSLLVLISALDNNGLTLDI
jgi:hypothetical protein